MTPPVFLRRSFSITELFPTLTENLPTASQLCFAMLALLFLKKMIDVLQKNKIPQAKNRVLIEMEEQKHALDEREARLQRLEYEADLLAQKQETQIKKLTSNPGFQKITSTAMVNSPLGQQSTAYSKPVRINPDDPGILDALEENILTLKN